MIVKQEAYEEFEMASRHKYDNGNIGHTWTEKSAFFAGWHAALAAVRAQDDDMLTLDQMLKERAKFNAHNSEGQDDA